jgi:DNA-binding transcriptional regulator YiaG
VESCENSKSRFETNCDIPSETERNQSHFSASGMALHKLRKRKWFKSLPASIKTLGEWIQVRRQEKKLSPYHLAAKMGIATALVQSWESGASDPDDRQRQMLCSVFGSDFVGSK